MALFMSQMYLAEHRRSTHWGDSKSNPTSFPGSLFSASLSQWNRDPGCGWSRDHPSLQNDGVGGY